MNRISLPQKDVSTIPQRIPHVRIKPVVSGVNPLCVVRKTARNGRVTPLDTVRKKEDRKRGKYLFFKLIAF